MILKSFKTINVAMKGQSTYSHIIETHLYPVSNQNRDQSGVLLVFGLNNVLFKY